MANVRISSVHSSLDSYFQISKRGSSIVTEIRAGISSFLTLSYLLLINPQILAVAGVPTSNGVVATALSSACASFFIGVVANLPFGMAPGLGLSAYMAYGIVELGILDLSEALSASLIVGFLLFILSISQVASLIMKVTPMSVKFGIIVGMGLLISMIGMVSVHLIVADPKTLVALGDVSDINIRIIFVGIITIVSLVYHNITGGILLNIVMFTFIFWHINNEIPSSLVAFPTIENYPSALLNNYSCIMDRECIAKIFPCICSFLLICIFDIAGVTFGLSKLAGIPEQGGKVNNTMLVLIASFIGTTIAALFGSTPIIATVESATGIKEGGRTGLTAVTVSILFLVSLFLSPILGAVPAQATAPALVLIGTLMMGECKEINWEKLDEATPAFLTISMMPLTYSITNGILFGLVSSFCLYITTGNLFRDLRKSNRKDLNKATDEIRKDTYEMNSFLDAEEPDDHKEFKLISRINSFGSKGSSFHDDSMKDFPSITRLNSFGSTGKQMGNYGSIDG